jgi:hypothetical protein
MSSFKKPFCKVCYDTGKPESEYTSHYVKDIPGPNGCVVCPTLLALECRYCRKNGHTVSKCPEIARRNNESNKYYKRKYYNRTQNTTIDKKTIKKDNRFTVFDDDDEEEIQPDVVTKEPLTIEIPEPEGDTYASILKRDYTVSPGTPPGSPPPLCRTPSYSPPSTPPPRKRWSEMTDSDDEF